ncbi:hypothetical protein Bequi_11895 [Brachybacterium sp. JHP9]|uniref:Uncharacterized protein n=1 Tax=Brachybacterium equifaecis TaxID=2910770 RepID=A0ABT0R2S6_9MICO|nr:hypothetical protein [Brachybacterium equifaecis]MCL6424070.1 hypothetical protein [Brachybacterium equifaecis]
MNARPRTLGRTAALAASGLALTLALAGCGGSGTDAAPSSEAATASAAASSEAATTEAATTEAATTEAETTEAAAPAEVTEADLATAEQRYIDFVNALANKDANAACGFMMDPTTNEPVSGATQAVCASALESDGIMDQFTPEIAGVFTTDLLEAKPAANGTIDVTANGDSLGVFTKAGDGQWYMLAPQG